MLIFLDHVLTSHLPSIKFDLIDRKELVPLEELNDAILAEGDFHTPNTPKPR